MLSTMKQYDTFEKWKQAVNAASELGGLTTNDLPDCPYYDWYDSGMTPAEAASEAIKNANE